MSEKKYRRQRRELKQRDSQATLEYRNSLENISNPHKPLMSPHEYDVYLFSYYTRLHSDKHVYLDSTYI